MTKRFVVIFSALTLLSSCGKLFTKSTATEEVKQEQSRNTVVEVPYDNIAGEGIEKQRSWNDIVASLDDNENYDELYKEVNKREEGYFTSEFSEGESQHVRNNTHDPFEGKEMFVLPLSEMNTSFCYPYKGKFLSDFGIRRGRMHSGVDIKAIPRDTIRAAFDGVVRLSKPYSGYGNVIIIRHYNGIETLYSHNYKNLVRVNQVVKSGMPIALAGRTGRATTEHLHFEVRISGQAVNPNLFIDVNNFTLKQNDLYVYKKGAGVTVTAKAPKQESYDAQPSQQIERATILVNAEKVTPTAETPKTTITPQITTGQSSSEGASYHKIVKGDTLSKLAAKYGTSVDKICKLNNFSKDKILSLNQKVRVK